MIAENEVRDNAAIKGRYRMLLRSLGEKCTKAELKTLRQALNLAISAHKGVRRKSGEPYILHPMEVAQIVVDEIGLGPTSATAALLHDVVEDSDFTLNDIERLFGQKTARIIDGLTKISGFSISTAQNRPKISEKCCSHWAMTFG